MCHKDFVHCTIFSTRVVVGSVSVANEHHTLPAENQVHATVLHIAAGVNLKQPATLPMSHIAHITAERLTHCVVEKGCYVLWYSTYSEGLHPMHLHTK